MKTMTTVLAAVVMFLGLGGSGCGSNATALTPAQAFGQKYKFANNEISGWTQDTTDPTAYAVYTGEAELIARIDGAAGAYTERGCVMGMYQDLVHGDQSTAGIIAMDYVTADQASAMFDWKKADQSATIVIPPYDASVAIGSSGLTGLSVLAHFNASYFELVLSGYGEQNVTCSACPVAKQFLDALKAKTN